MELCKVTLLLILWVTSCTCQKTDKTADVVVLVDGSSEISATSFQQMKIIINRIIQELEKVSMIGRDIRFGVSQFSDDVQDEVLLKQNFKKNELLRYLKREFVQKHGQRNSSRALEHAHDVLFQQVSGSRRLMGYPQFLVVFIGGKSQDEFRHAVEMVKYLGVKIIAVGIQDYDAAELNLISKQQFIQKQNPQLFQDIANAIQGELKNPFISGEKPSACKQATADIVFLVDYTDDIGEGNFLQLQKFFYEVFSSFSISKDGVRIGLSMLSETRNAGFHLSRYNSQAEILQHVKDLQYTRGTGRPASTTKSIEELFSQQNGGRAELFVPQIAVFVTNNGSWNDIKEMADKLHSSNVDTFAVGVGVAHEKKLSIISSYPPHNFILSADTFLQLASSLQETFIKRLCLFLLGHQLPRNMDVLRDGCVNTEEIDVYFMIDGSGSISREQFRKIKGFLSQMADIFKVTPEGVRIGVVQYSTDVVTEFHLGQYNSARDLKLAISDIKQQKKKTFTGKALSHMTRLFLQSASNRPSAQQYLIVLTDGKSDDEVSIPAEELRNMTVHIYAIGVGDAVVSELNEIAGRTDRYFHINNFHFLDDIKEELIEEICLPAASKHKEADMVFLIHSSTSSSHFKFEQVKEFMEEFLQQFTISEDKVRIAVMQYSDTVKHEFGFDANIGEEAVLNAINVMQPFQGTETKTGHALSSMSEIFRSDSTREYVDKVLIVVTDEKSTDSVQKPARDLRKEGINIISIGSSRADIEQLVDISGSTESSFYVENYVKVPLESMTFTANVQENDCKSISVADVVFVVDTSSSIDSTEFKSMIDFMLSVVNSSDVGPESVHFGVSLYSDDAQKAFGLQDHLTRESLVKAISDLKPRYGNTYTAKAIKFSKDLLSESEGGRGHQKVPQFLITITDGDSNDHDDLESVCDTVRASSINTIAVGIDEAIKSELDMIAGSEDNQFYVKTFDKLKNVKNILTKKLCQDKYCPCQEIDVIFLIDGSESIDKDSDFPIIKHFVKNITQSLDVCKYSRVGLAQYSQDFEMYFEMSHFCQMSEFNNKVDAVQQLEQGTWTAKALKEARKFVTPDKKRGGIQPRLILMTDGKSKDSDEISKNAADLREKDKVEILVVAVGDKKNIKYEKLRQIAGKDSNVFNVRGYEELRRLKRSIIPNICDEEKCKKPNDCQIDVAVGIDFTQMHGTALFSAHFQLKRNLLPILKSINSLLQTSCTSDIHIRFGFNIDNTPVKPNSTFQDLTFFEDRDYFKGLGQILQASGLNRQYLRSFGETFALESSTTAQQVILIFTDGLDDDKEILKRESDQLITEGVDGLITVALEGTGDIQDLQSIEFGRGYRYRPQLVIGDKTAAHLYTAFDNLAEEKCCDCCKCTGPQGSEGDPGRPGDKGEKGQKGGSGFPGEEGPPGVPGSPGSQGPTGDRGCNGQSGLKGSYGYTGEKGDPGDDGWDGISGPEGDEGDPGLKGEKGNEGNPGIPGVPGQPGGKGEKGLTGDPGQPGLDSYTPGEKGETGPTGREGNPGSKGRDGPRGDPGRDGLNGQRGPPGAQGSQGPPGDNGSKGENGSRGKQGPRGQPGEKGLPGDSGIKGPQGAQGPPGGKGSKGGQGTRGQKGQPGDPGVKGDIGSQGFRGQPGFNGRDRYGGKGQKGYKGDRGCQGHQGAQGQIGDKGSEGQKGHKGNRGKSGDGGSKGETGPPGSPGYDGHRGPKGPPGVPEQTECKLLEYIRKNCACRGCSDCPNYPLELVVAVDESGGVTSQQWDRMRDLVLRIVREISISESTCPSGAHLAVVSYSSRVKRLIEFSDYHTKKKLLELVQREIIRDSSRGSRKMGEAMMYTARHMFKRVRSGKLVKKMAIFMTTGPPADTENLFSAVLELGVSNIIPVIVTSGQVNIDLLSQAFSDCPGRYEVINNIWEPERIINRLNQCFFCYDACNPDPSCKVGDPACLADMPMDVALLLDSSHGMSSAEFEKARDFLDATVDMFSQPCSTRPRAGARLALVQPRQLSSRKEDPVMVEFDFAQFRLNRTGVKQHIKRSLRQLRSTSSLGLAVEYILGNLFQQQQRTKVIFTILGSGSYQQDRRLAEIALKAKCQGYILFTLVLGRRASNTEIGLLSSPPVSYHSCQVGRVMEPDMDYALRHAKYFFSNLQRRKSDYPPSSLPQCQERGDGSPFEDLLWISDIQSDSSHAQSETDHSQPVYNMETIVQTKNRAGGVYQEEKLQATEPEREETARQNGQQEIQPERENTRENGHLPISEPATEQATEPDNKKLTRADINILKNNPEIKPPTLTRCLLNMDYGRTCKGNQAIRWFYNRNTKSCSIFWYGGCGGNGNRFLTKESCLHHCIPQRPVE